MLRDVTREITWDDKSLGQWQMTGFCIHGDEPSSSVEGGECIQ
jgi:hypothetical protein